MKKSVENGGDPLGDGGDLLAGGGDLLGVGGDLLGDGGYYYVISTLCVRPKTLIEWKSESVTNGPTNI